MFFLFNDHYNKCLINYKYYILYCNYKVCIHTACFCWSISLDKASFHFICETFTWLYIFWGPPPHFFPRYQCTTVSYNERTRIFTHPRPSSSTWRQKQHSICLHHNSQVNKCIFLCMFVLVKLWSAWGGVSLVYRNMYNVSKLVSVGRFNIQTNKKLPCKNSTLFICESWWMFQTPLNIFQTYFGLNNDIFS